MSWMELLILSVRNPAEAARIIGSVRVARSTLYEAVVAVAALNALLVGVSSIVIPQPAVLPAFMAQPFLFFVVVAGGLVIYANLLYWAGRAMGGQGDMGTILALVVWLQALRAVAQAALIVLSLAMPSIGALFGLVVAFYALYVLIQFVKVGHGFRSAWSAIGLLLAVSAGLVIILMAVLTLAGVPMEGVA